MCSIFKIQKWRYCKYMKENHSIGLWGQPAAWGSFSNAPVPFQVKAYSWLQLVSVRQVLAMDDPDDMDDVYDCCPLLEKIPNAWRPQRAICADVWQQLTLHLKNGYIMSHNLVSNIVGEADLCQQHIHLAITTNKKKDFGGNYEIMKTLAIF